MSKRIIFDALSQKLGESAQDFADRVQHCAIGAQRSHEEIVHRFIVGLSDKHMAE